MKHKNVDIYSQIKTIFEFIIYYIINMLVELANKKLKQLGLTGTIFNSTKPDKKLMLKKDGKVIHFGSKTSKTYLEGATEEKRRAYRARHDKIYLKDGTKARNVKYSPAHLSYNILW